MFPVSLESDRLEFTRLSRDNIDTQKLYEVLGTPNPNVDEVFRYLDFNPHQTLKETYDFVVRAEEEWEEGEKAKYIVRPKRSEDHGGTTAGFAGLYPHWERRSATLGIVLDKPFWGNGYSSERAEVFIEVAFDVLDLDMVAVQHIDGNRQSRRAVETYVETFNGRYEGLLRNWMAVGDEVFDCHRYSIRREEYLQSRS